MSGKSGNETVFCYFVRTVVTIVRKRGLYSMVLFRSLPLKAYRTNGKTNYPSIKSLQLIGDTGESDRKSKIFLRKTGAKRPSSLELLKCPPSPLPGCEQVFGRGRRRRRKQTKTAGEGSETMTKTATHISASEVFPGGRKPHCSHVRREGSSIRTCV